MKRSILFAAILMTAFALASCGHKDDDQSYKDFVGIWGVEQIDYYNIDYAGAPIESSRETYYFTPGDFDSGIELVFREDKTGEMRDHSLDTFYVELDTNPVTYDTIINPDSTVYTHYDYTYDAEESVMYMTMASTHTYKMSISHFDHNTYTYINEYRLNYIEEAKLVRISEAAKTRGIKPVQRPVKSGSFLSNR